MQLSRREMARAPALVDRYLVGSRWHRSICYFGRELHRMAHAIDMMPGIPDAGRQALRCFSAAFDPGDLLIIGNVASILNSLQAPPDLRRPDAIAWQIALDRLALAVGLSISEVAP